jgi:hypothetical protein
VAAPRSTSIRRLGRNTHLLPSTTPAAASGSNLTFESRVGIPGGLDKCESGGCEPEFPLLSSPLIAAVQQFKLSNDPKFIDKLRDVVGLYVNPPAHAIVLSVDEKSQIQALDRAQPGLPMKKVAPAR